MREKFEDIFLALKIEGDTSYNTKFIESGKGKGMDLLLGLPEEHSHT